MVRSTKSIIFILKHILKGKTNYDKIECYFYQANYKYRKKGGMFFKHDYTILCIPNIITFLFHIHY